MEIRKLKKAEKPPMDLLLLADPLNEIVKRYVNRASVL